LKVIPAALVLCPFFVRKEVSFANIGISEIESEDFSTFDRV
jgi:hypothetical protein|tara:strand:- start:5246 stop:5368 length:123 start_codon:yes stop_codon:yes gene_type:complete